MARFIRRVTAVNVDNGGDATVLLDSRRKKRKKTSRLLRPTERILRRYLKAERRCWTDLENRHLKSRGKKRDRWLTDGVTNSLKSLDKGCRVFGKI